MAPGHLRAGATSAPDPIASSPPTGLLRLFLDGAGSSLDARAQERIGALVARYWILRDMSLAVARLLDSGVVPSVEAAMIKDLGTTFEVEVLDVVRDLAAGELELGGGDPFAELLAEATITAPTFTLRGGTNEVLRGVVAKSLLRDRRAS